METKAGFSSLPEREKIPTSEMKTRAREFLEELKSRRTVRDFSDRPVPREVIENCLLAAGRAPSGANQQPWHFAVVGDPVVKKKIRVAAEKEEEAFYGGRAGDEWLEALAHLGTDAEKPFLEKAPYLIVIFAERYSVGQTGEKQKNYYVTESVGIATGMLITAINKAGLVSLTHTPSPMGFFNEALGRPENEKAFLILVVGYPDPDALVPDITKKSLEEIATFFD